MYLRALRIAARNKRMDSSDFGFSRYVGFVGGTFHFGQNAGMENARLKKSSIPHPHVHSDLYSEPSRLAFPNRSSYIAPVYTVTGLETNAF